MKDFVRRSGVIPKRLNIYCRPEETIVLEGVTNEVVVIPAFACDSENEVTQKTAQEWANLPDAPASVIRDRENSFKDVRIFSLERRGGGGRAFKVLADGFYFDLREDVLLDTLLHSKIEEGRLFGEFVFASAGSQFLLVRVGSDLHSRLLDETQRRKKSRKIRIKELVPGEVYRNKAGDYAVFLGKVDTTALVRYIAFLEKTREEVGMHLCLEEEGIRGSI